MSGRASAAGPGAAGAGARRAAAAPPAAVTRTAAAPPGTAPGPVPAPPPPVAAPPVAVAAGTTGVSAAPAGGGPAPVPPPAPAAKGKRAVAVARAPRRARVYVTRVDPWSVMKAAFMLSLSLAIILVVMLASLWWVLDVTGVFDAISRNVDEVVGGGTTTFDLNNVLSFGRVMGVAVLLAAVEIVLLSALATLFAFLYNLTVGITGGVEVTLSDDA